MTDWKPWLIAGIAGIAIYAMFKKTSGTSKEIAQTTFEKAGYTSYITPKGTTLNSDVQLVVKDFSSNMNTTYFFEKSDLEKFNWAQRFLLSVGIPARWVLT